MSTSTGVAPARPIAATVATAVCATVITSSPGPMCSARSASVSASVPGVDADAAGRACPGGEFVLEGGHLRAQNVPAALQHAQRGGVQFRALCLVGGPQVVEGNGHVEQARSTQKRRNEK